MAGAAELFPDGRQSLEEVAAEAGIDRGAVYVTNAVKHFKWRPAGKVRLHQKPNASEIGACRVWWQRELALVQPKVFGLLGATAAQAVLGSKFRVTRERGEFRELQPGVLAVATIHRRRSCASRRAVDARRTAAHDLCTTQGGTPMAKKFVQIIEYQTTKFEEMRKLNEEWLAATEGKRSAGRAIDCSDRDRPNMYFTVVEFPSYEEAMRNNDLPETQAMAQKMQALADGPPVFRNLDLEWIYED